MEKAQIEEKMKGVPRELHRICTTLLSASTMLHLAQS